MLRRCLYMRAPGVVKGYIPTPSAQRLILLDKLLRLRHTIETRPQMAMSRKEFDTAADGFGMSPAEGKFCLEAFSNAGVVIIGAEGTIITDVRKGLDSYHAALGTKTPCASHHLVEHRNRLSKELEVLNVRKRAVDRTVATQWSRFWSAVVVGSSAQMLTLCYLTFVALDWDIMEPTCYFIQTGTILVFFAFMIYFRKEHCPTVWDQCVLPKYVEELYSNSTFDIRRWLELNQQIRRVDAQILQTKGYSEHAHAM